MCGRFVQVAFDPPAYPKIKGADWFAELPPLYNLAPTQRAGLVFDDDGLTAGRFRWGLLPFWAKDAKLAYTTINARIESVAEKPAFRDAFKRRRCLIPMAGYYEWTQLTPKLKQPWFIRDANDATMWAAGLWEAPHKLLGEDAPATFTIITRDAFGRPADFHDRMPVILPVESAEEWLHASTDDAMAMLLAASPTLKAHKVAREVGNVKNQGPQLIEEVA